MTLPPWARAVQQSYAFHILVVAFIVGGAAVFDCWGKSDTMTWACIKGGLVIAGGYLFGIMQHSPGSASFKPDGEVNQPVAQVVKMQAEDIPVKVVAAK